MGFSTRVSMVRNWVNAKLVGLVSGLKGASEQCSLERRGERELELRRVRRENNAIEFLSFLMMTNESSQG